MGENIRRRREAAGLSQEELAARMGVDQGYLSRLELGQRNPTILTVWHAAMALAVRPAVLLELPSEPKSRPRRSRSSSRR